MTSVTMTSATAASVTMPSVRPVRPVRPVRAVEPTGRATIATELDSRVRPAAASSRPAPPDESGPWFETEVRPHFQTLYRYALRMTRDPDAADDLLQDTLERGYRKRALFQPGTDLRAWLLSVMRNVWITGHRRRSHQLGTISLDALDEAAGPRDSCRDGTGASAVETSVVDRLGETAILAAIAALPPLYRDVVLLADVHDVQYKRIGELLRIPVGSVCSRLSRGRERVRRMLLEQHHDTGCLARAG